jgi:tRNA-splicing ligase RtcB
MAVQKPLYHLATAKSAEEFRLRRRLYFSSVYPPVERDSVEGERLMLSNIMAMNYGWAFRVAVFSILTKLLGESLGAQDCRLVVDSPHNTAYEEEIGGRRAIVHRHNAARAFPASKMADHPLFGVTGQPLLLPGTNRTSSYLCVAGEGAVDSLYSVSHGAGSNVKQFEKSGLSSADVEGRRTLRFSYKEKDPREVAQLDDEGVNDALETLAAHDIVRPVARLRPFAVLN